MEIYNSLTRKKELFRPITKKNVRFYTCGPTVYNYAHIGNLRTFIFEDILKKTLIANGYLVTHIMNITDVDDKTIKKALEEHATLTKVTRRYEKAFKQDLRSLNIAPPTRFTRATEHINDMKKLISVLLKKKRAYIKDGSVYFSIKSFPHYGRLSRITAASLKTNARGDVDEYEKEEVRDFALWKATKEGEPSWPAPFGRGRPGWHIECSAMAMRYLKSPFDIHAGAIDLLFPHHENEIAQSEAATGKQFVKYWVHGEHLSVDGNKMSKSLKNDFTLRNLEDKHISPLVFRYLVLTSHYRSRLNFTWESLQAADSALTRIYDTVLDLKTKKVTGTKTTSLQAQEKEFFAALSDDLNTPRAIGVIQESISAYHKNPESTSPRELLAFLYKADQVLSLGFKRIKPVAIPSDIQLKLAQREQARAEKDFARADALRAELVSLGWTIEDTSQGPRLKQTRP